VPGAQDRWGQLADPGAPRYEAINADFPYGTEQPERGSIADLRRRMERLPPGHPSSPYNDDMTPKPPVARLKNLELPLHGTEQNSNGASAGTAHEPAEDGLADTRTASATSTWASAANTARPVSASTPRPVSASTPRPVSASTPRPVSASTPRPVSASTPRPVSASTPRPAPESTTTTASASNGASGRNRVASTLGTAEQLLTRARLVTAGEPPETAEEPESVAGEPDGNGLDGSALDPNGLDANGLDANGLDGSAEGPRAVSGWLSTPTWADTDLGTADGAAGLTSQEGTASWNTPAWDDAPSWDDAPDLESAPDLNDASSNGASHEWSEPEPGADTLTHATIEPNPGRAADEPRTGPDGSWEWNGRYLTPDESRIADEALGRCRIAEGRNVFGGYGHSGLTPAMRRIEAQLEHGQLLAETETSALKPADSFKQKLADLIMRHPDKSAEELALEVHDGIRYAFIFDAEHYADGTLQAHSRFKGNGFDLEVRRNCWQNQEYKGINSRWRDPAHDLVFEVQFHTAASWEVSQRAHSLYEAITDPATPPEERARLRSIYAEMSAAVPVPRGCATIPAYRKEG
jgi:hypothetical protein